ncbi:inhibitor of apoptosis repeat-containing protein [Pyrenochaeta sp. DS3sAY3a]|nr:inhibitor of apoptosis repeat-containing protein [Pyrenochaeta sp. DS3sAY3a]
MDASLASFHTRLATFEAVATTKTRRTSNRSKKAAPKSKAKESWPLSSPSAQDLAFAGFVWKPTTASPDNVQCFHCTCQLDGWEESDVPAFEHLTHSPNCGFAIVTCIRLRAGDPGRTEEDPTGENMVAARRETFGDMWPLDSAAGFPSVDQMVSAGWYYDPAEDTPDGVTCPYCSLSLDAWDAGDDPLEEHRRRSQDCLFFALSELYHPAPAPKKGKRTSTKPKAKKASTRSSSVSATTSKKKAPRSSSASTAATSKKATRGKKRTSDSLDEFSEVVLPTSKATRGKKRTSDSLDEFSEVALPASKRIRPSNPSSLADGHLTGTLKKTPSELNTFSEVIVPAQTRRLRSSSLSSLPPGLPTGTPKKTPSEQKTVDYSSFDMSSLPPGLPVGTPKKTPSGLKETVVSSFEMSSLPLGLPVGTPKQTPSRYREVEDAMDIENWQPTDVKAFFAEKDDVAFFVNNVLVDVALDDVPTFRANPMRLYDDVVGALTDMEKKMTVEQWVLYNAQRGEEKLRAECEQQILAFEAEGRRALDKLQSIPTH